MHSRDALLSKETQSNLRRDNQRFPTGKVDHGLYIGKTFVKEKKLALLHSFESNDVYIGT